MAQRGKPVILFCDLLTQFLHLALTELQQTIPDILVPLYGRGETPETCTVFPGKPPGRGEHFCCFAEGVLHCSFISLSHCTKKIVNAGGAGVGGASAEYLSVEHPSLIIWNQTGAVFWLREKAIGFLCLPWFDFPIHLCLSECFQEGKLYSLIVYCDVFI